MLRHSWRLQKHIDRSSISSDAEIFRGKMKMDLSSIIFRSREDAQFGELREEKQWQGDLCLRREPLKCGGDGAHRSLHVVLGVRRGCHTTETRQIDAIEQHAATKCVG